jgi:hypothetical protein
MTHRLLVSSTHCTVARIMWSRVSRVFAVVGLAAALLAVAASGAGAVSARAARSCSPPRYPGTGYFTSLSVRGVSCATGRRLALAFYHCRRANGVAGRCHRRVLGYTCREHRSSIPTEIDARVTCRRGHRTVVHTYQQDT